MPSWRRSRPASWTCSSRRAWSRSASTCRTRPSCWSRVPNASASPSCTSCAAASAGGRRSRSACSSLRRRRVLRRRGWRRCSRRPTASNSPTATSSPRRGQVMGAREAGVPDLKLARLARDRNLLVRARELAAVLDEDPALERPSRALREAVEQAFGDELRLAAEGLAASAVTLPGARPPVYSGMRAKDCHRHTRQRRLRRLRRDGGRAEALSRGASRPERLGQPGLARVSSALRRPRAGRRSGDVDLEAVERLILVDTVHPNRIGDLAPLGRSSPSTTTP